MDRLAMCAFIDDMYKHDLGFFLDITCVSIHVYDLAIKHLIRQIPPLTSIAFRTDEQKTCIRINMIKYRMMLMREP